MSLEPAITLSATRPHMHGYDPATPDAPYLDGFLYAFGVYTHSTMADRTLRGQVDNHELILGDVGRGTDEVDNTDWDELV